MSAQTRLHAYASPSWLRAVCDIVRRQLATSGVDLAGCDYVIGEEFVDVPAAVNDSGPRIGWHVRIEDGYVTTVCVPPPPEADLVNVVDWAATEKFSRCSTTEMATDPDLAAAIAALHREGKLQRIVRRDQPSTLAAAFDSQRIHDSVVAITSPSVVGTAADLVHPSRLEQGIPNG